MLKSLKRPLHYERRHASLTINVTQRRVKQKSTIPHAAPATTTQQKEEIFDNWVLQFPKSHLSSLVKKCSNYQLKRPEDVSRHSVLAASCLVVALYLKCQREHRADLNTCTKILSDRLKPTSFISVIPDPTKQAPAIMVTSAVLVGVLLQKLTTRRDTSNLRSSAFRLSSPSQVLLSSNCTKPTTACSGL